MTTPEGKCKKDFCTKLRKLKCTVLQYKQDATTVAGFPVNMVFMV